MAALAALLLITATATAQAQDDSNATVEQAAKESDLDTDLTPVAKKSDLWTLVHGAPYPETETVEVSITTFDTQLHAVAFENPTIGLAAGSRCAIEPIRQKGEQEAEFGARARECRGTDQTQVPRVPALYRYTEPPNEDPLWERLELPGEDDHAPGYIGAIAWIDPTRALIVGGTGAYPERELAADGKAPTDPTKADEAGKARAWVYHRASDTAPERVAELDLSALTAETTLDGAPRAGMRGLSAVDCYRDPAPKPGEAKLELCFAGALGQIWEWRDGKFNGERIDASSDPQRLVDPSLFRYRVRDIAFDPSAEPPLASAATAGCCATNPNQNTPRVIFYDDSPGVSRPCQGCDRKAPPRWYARPYLERATIADPGNPLPPSISTPGSVSTPGQPPKCAFDLFGICVAPMPGIDSQTVEVPGGSQTVGVPGGGEPLFPDEVSDADERRREADTTPTWPDSIYSIRGNSAILTPGGPEQANEKPSVITSGTTGAGSKHERELDRSARFSTTRLLDGDGITGGAVAEPAWAVGELRSTERSGLGARGLVVANGLARPTAASAVNASAGISGGALNPQLDVRPTPEEAIQGYEPIDQEKLDASIRSRHYFLPSYTANAVEIVGNDEDAWMVGDHGAILRISEKQRQKLEGAAEPKPPRLGAPRPRSLSERGAYEARELPREAGSIPRLGGETEALDEPKMIGAGSLGTGVNEIVISRDGSEGWAIGGSKLVHYDGVSWTPCDPVGIEGSVPPDPACSQLATREANGNVRLPSFNHIARVPLENDDDPTNDDELEIVALDGKSAMARYRDGAWQLLGPEAVAGISAHNVPFPDRPIDIAFTAPDEGWMVTQYGVRRGTGQGTTWLLRVFRFDGERWVSCDAEPQRCGDDDRLGGIAGVRVHGLVAAGERIYAFGRRLVGVDSLTDSNQRQVPLILYRDPGGPWTDGSGEGEDGGGFDPGFANPGTEQGGRVDSLTVLERAGGGFEGWAVGKFGGTDDGGAFSLAKARIPPQAVLMRLDPDEAEGWRRFQSPGSLDDNMRCCVLHRSPVTDQQLHVAYSSEAHPDGVFIGQRNQGGSYVGDSGARIFGFDAARERFEMLDSGRPQGTNGHLEAFPAFPQGAIQAMAPDGHGGFWAAISGYMFHYTDEPPRPVFPEVANPIGIRDAKLTALAGGPDGSVWAASDSERLYRYERGLGWEEARIPGWDPGRVVTRASAVNEIAIGPGGEGLAVGEGGRIAELSPESVVLDAAAGRSCALGDPSPCGSVRELGAVDIAPDGSALVAGERLALLWRSPGGEFDQAARPQIGSSTAITAVSYPTPTRAYLATDAGIVFRGDLTGATWAWERENVTPDGEPISIGALRDVAVDAAGHGYAVGQSGILERSAAGAWRRLAPRYGGASEVELPETGGEGVLIGGAHGRILAGAGSRLHVARADQGSDGEVVGLAYLPGSSEGSVDAWAGIAQAGDGDSLLLRHRTNPADPLLDPAAVASTLPDAPAPAEGELSLAAFGKSDCDRAEDKLCPEMTATTTTNELIQERIIDELASLRASGELDLALQSGDATDSAGLPASSLGDLDWIGSATSGFTPNHTQLAGQRKHRLWSELVADELVDRGVPVFAAVGGQDLSEGFACDSASGSGCAMTKPYANAGENYSWREAFAGRAAPWGDDSDDPETESQSELSFEPAPGSNDNSVRTENQRVDADGEGAVPEAKAEIGGASTHYAVDAVSDGEPIARIVFVDTSLRSLAASDAQQQPHELGGGQQRFLERMICKEGQSSTFGERCTREKGQRAIVVSNTPTYSYGPGVLTHTATDAATFEATMLRYDVDLVVSGALGYSGLYYTLAPGLHEPCPGGGHPQSPPTGKTPDCVGGPTGPAEQATKGTPADADPASLLSEQGLTGAYPTLIASGAGGKFGPDGREGSNGPEGRWHGYSVARLMPNGDIAIEQRPILDWIGLEASRHMIRPRQKLLLNGYGRSPISTTTQQQRVRAFHYEISSAAITHRYELLRADPEQPWLPLEDAEAGIDADGAEACEGYVCLPSEVATVDSQSGQVKAGSGKHPPTYAVAMLSVGEEVATTPLFFEPSPAFRAAPVGIPNVPPTPAPLAAPGAPSAPPNPQIPSVSFPTAPVPPALVPPPPAPPASPPSPPVPPPVPPADSGLSPLSLSFAPTGLIVAPTTSVIPPPAPPINPAPPGGARKEARQRQAASQSSGADGAEGGSEGAEVDTADSPNGARGAEMTRRETGAEHHAATRADRTKPAASFTPLPPKEQASAWTSTALYGGGMTLMAFALAIGWTHGRPTPRRRAPHVPAPAQAWTRRPNRR